MTPAEKQPKPIQPPMESFREHRGRKTPNTPTRALTVTAITALLMGSSATAALSQASASARSPQTHGQHVAVGPATRSTRPDQADWAKINATARMRRIALAPHRSARFRAFAAYLGLSELMTIHPLAPGRCATAVIYLYNNLLDLDNAYPGENWAPLRRLVAREPSIRACTP